MAFGGNLEDLPFADIIQLLHVSKKSGILNINGPNNQKAKIFLNEGFLVSAVHPNEKTNVIEILLQNQTVTQAQLDEANSQIQMSTSVSAPVIMSLVNLNYLNKQDGWQILKDVIQKTMAEIISWKEGTFSFDMCELDADEEFKHFPEEMETWAGVDTQWALMEALKVFDEKNRVIEEKKEIIKKVVAHISKVPETPGEIEPEFDFRNVPPDDTQPEDTQPEDTQPEDKQPDDKQPTDKPHPDRQPFNKRLSDQPNIDEIAKSIQNNHKEKEFLQAIEEMNEDVIDFMIYPKKTVIFLCNDAFVKHSMRRFCKDNSMSTTISDVERDLNNAIDEASEDGHSIILLADLVSEMASPRGAKRRMAMVNRIKKLHPEVPLVILSNSFGTKAYTKLFEMGGRTMIPKPEKKADNKKYVSQMKRFFDVLIGCLNSIYDEDHLRRARTQESRFQITSLKKRIHEIQDRKTSPDISLIILEYIAEFLQRGIIFLVRKKDLLGLGSFGMNADGNTISTAAMRLRVPLDKKSAFTEVIKTGVVYRGTTEDAVLSEYVLEKIGYPATQEFLLLPLKTENKTIALVYCDFGKREAGPLKTDALEILASQAGMAMEIALQKSRTKKD